MMKDLDTRSKILAAARKLFAQQGYSATSVKQICTEAGVNVSLISYYFGGKEQVLVELLQTSLFDIPIFKNHELKDDPITGIEEIVAAIVNFRVANPEIMTILHREILNEAPRNDQVKSHIYPLWNRLRHYLEKGLEAKVFDFKSINLSFQLVISTIIFPRINPNFLKPFMKDGETPTDVMIDCTMDFILKGLGYRFD